MSIDIERLKVDAGYWKENGAPDDATHCAVHDPGKTWFKFGEDGSPMMWHMRFSEWREGLCKESRLVDLIPRLARADELEWNGSDLPPVGTECEAVWLEMPDGGDRDFERVIVKGYWEKQVWFCTADGEDLTHLSFNVDFRPIRTWAQTEREELISAATEILNQDHVLTERDAAEALYDAGMLRGAGE